MPENLVLVTYNNSALPAPTPYVSVNNEIIRYGSRFASVNKITINGQITGQDFAALGVAQSVLTDIFSESYKELIITQSSQDAIIFSGCSVESISFDNSNYNRIVPYSIELQSYPSGNSFFGILEPKDEIRISAGNDGFGTVSHSVSAKGFSIGDADTAINSAKNFVAGRSAAGVTKIAAMAKLEGSATAFTPILVNVSENLNRLDLTYSLEKSYKFKLLSGVSDFLTSYSTTLSSGAGDDFVTATIQGEIRHPKTGAGTLSSLYTKLSDLSPYSVISATYGSPNGLAFCQDPISFSVTEDSGTKKINFNASYDNSEFYGAATDAFSFGGCYFDAQTSCTIDELTNTTTIDVKGDIKCRGGQKERYSGALGYLTQLTTAGSSSSSPRIYDFAKVFYDAYCADFSSVLALNPIPNSLSIDSNAQLGTISVSASFDNKDRFNPSLSSSEYSIQHVPSNTVYTSNSSCNLPMKHLAVDINTQTRGSATLDISLSGPGVSESILINIKNSVITNFKSNFVETLGSPTTIQQTNSSSSVSNSKGTNSATGSMVRATSAYSFDPKNPLNIIKSQ